MADSVQIPDFLPERYFVQPLTAYGVFVDRFGTITSSKCTLILRPYMAKRKRYCQRSKLS